LVLVADALPGTEADDERTIGINGLADDPVTTALLALISDASGRWIARGSPNREPLVAEPRLLAYDDDDPLPVDAGRAHGAIWHHYHDLALSTCFEDSWRNAYRRLNEAFAAAAAEEAAPGATVWVHDYKLQLVPGLLRRLRPDLRIGLNLQTPFPADDRFQQLPMHRELLAGMLGADLVGFPTPGAVENFLRIALTATASPPSVGVFPAAADTSAIDTVMREPVIALHAARLRRRLGNPRTILLCVNTADPVQGIDQRLRSLGQLFHTGRLNSDQVAVVQIVLGEPVSVDSATADRVARATARINGDFGAVGRPCIHYVISRPNLAERVVLYRAADIMLATPQREGATLPALEFAAAARNDAALILSRFSGSAAALSDAYLVNPLDEQEVNAALLGALDATADERATRIRAMRELVRAYDNRSWADGFLRVLKSRNHRPSRDSHGTPQRGPSLRQIRHTEHPRQWWLNVHSGPNWRP
jgi:trehalose 6-phosphate synthase